MLHLALEGVSSLVGLAQLAILPNVLSAVHSLPLRRLASGMSLHRCRGVLPLPVASLAFSVDESKRRVLPRAVQRRLARRSHRSCMCSEVATSLNQLYLGAATPVTALSSRPTDAQSEAWKHIDQSCFAMGCPPEDLDPQGAVAELLGSRSYADASNATAPMDVSRLALPPEGFTLVALEAMMSESEFSDLVKVVTQ